MDLQKAITWASNSHHGVLITLRKDGRPQSSDIAYAVIDGKFCISATATRAKTKKSSQRQQGGTAHHVTGKMVIYLV